MKKLTTFVFAMLLALSVFVTPAFATESGYAEVELVSAKAETSYRKTDVEIKYIEDLGANTMSAVIVDKKTGKTLETYSETPEIPIEEIRAMKSGKSVRATQTYNTTYSHYVTLEKSGNHTIKAYTWVEVNITADFSWAQINRVNKCGHQSGNSGGYSLQSANTTIRTTQFPCNTVSMQINGIIEVASSNSVGLSFDVLKPLGFGFSYSSSNTWTARKSYNRLTSFSLM